MADKELPLVSIIIPCRNEEMFIGPCIDSVLMNDYPKDRLELLVVDGESSDRTKDIVQGYCEKYSFISLLDNHRKIVSTALNIGIKRSKGEVIMRMDAHSAYEQDYISKCIKFMVEYSADNVGGVIHTLPGSKSLLAESIALALSHPFGVGNSYFRIGADKPIFVDTVPFGCYRREVFDRIGLFDEELIRNQDDEFNLRLIKNGGKILLVPEIISSYYTRASLLKLWNMYFQYGYFKPLVVRKVGAILTLRQTIPALFVGSLAFSGLLSFLSPIFCYLFIAVIGSYIVVDLGVSFLVALQRGLKYFLMMPLVFLTLHFSYGLGYMRGVFDFFLLRRYRTSKIKEVPLTR